MPDGGDNLTVELQPRALVHLSRLWLGLILLQVGLGAATIWTNKAADVATAHVLVGALALAVGAGYLWFAVLFLRQLRQARAELTLVRARQLFLASIIYLPLLLLAMVCDKLR